ncbi:hypothetical protein AC1031_018526 [Aphanomyces cochlioides]|nr:hypothetical protein AC1031_018526 [Aphanomyces cochlioides]
MASVQNMTRPVAIAPSKLATEKVHPIPTTRATQPLMIPEDSTGPQLPLTASTNAPQNATAGGDLPRHIPENAINSSFKKRPTLIKQSSSKLKSIIIKGFSQHGPMEQKQQPKLSSRDDSSRRELIKLPSISKDDESKPTGDQSPSPDRGHRQSILVNRATDTFGHKSTFVPDAPERVTTTPTKPNRFQRPSQVIHNEIPSGKTLMFASLVKHKAESIRTMRRESRHRRQQEAISIANRHKKVLQQYSIRTVKHAALEKEPIVELVGSQRFLILPTYTWYKGWQLLTLCIVLHQSVYIPYSLSFETINSTPPTGTSLTDFVTTIFCLDLLFSFNTAIADPYHPDKLILDRWTIARHYVFGWFFLDLISSLPIDLIVYSLTDSYTATTSSFNVLSLLKTLRLPRLLRLAQFVRILRLIRIPPELKRWLLYSRYTHLIRVVQLIVSFVYITHILNCVWNALNPDWVDDVFRENQVPNIYVLGFYYTLTTLMGQSIPLRTETQYIFSCLVIVVGALLMAMVFGNVSDLISNFNESPNNYRKKMEQLLSSMNLMHLPLDLQNRINEYYQVMWERHGTLDGQPLVFTNELSKNLAVEVELFVRMDMINRVPVFQKCSKKVVQDLVMKLDLQVYLAGDYIVVKGEVGSSMYFVQSGECEVTKPSKSKYGADEVLRRLTQGDYYGEIALLMNCKRTANVRANTFAEVCVLSRIVFDEITEKYPDDREKIESFITEMYDPKVLEAIMHQQTLDNPEKAFQARMTRCVDELLDFMHDSAMRLERLETMVETMVSTGDKSPPRSSLSNVAMAIAQKRRDRRESMDDIRKSIEKLSTKLQKQDLNVTDNDYTEVER